MPMSRSIGEAKTSLLKLVHLVEEVVLRRGPKLVPGLAVIAPDEVGAKRKPGRMRGRVQVLDDFDVWPEDVARALGVID